MSATVSCSTSVLNQEAASETFWPTKLKDLFPGFPEMFTSPCSMPGYLRNGHRARQLRAQVRGKWGPTHRCGLEARNGAKGSQRGEGRRSAHKGKQELSQPNFKVLTWKGQKHSRVPSQRRGAVLVPSVAWCLPKPSKGKSAPSVP